MTARLPRRTVRLRLTLWYGCLFLLSGTALLGITYGLVVHATGGIVFAGHDGNYGIATPGSPHHAHDAGNSTTAGDGTPLSAHQAQLLAQRSQAQALRQHGAELHALLVQSGIALAIMAACSIALGWFLAGRALRPVRTIITSARRISAASLDERLALAGPQDELRELGDTIDALLARLEASFRAQRQFIANASHELRTPLARQRMLSQVAIADPDASVESLRAAHERVLASGAQQERLIEALLTLARGQAGLDRREPADLAAIVGQVAAARQAQARSLGLGLRTALGPAAAQGSPGLVERLITNLIDNAITHNVMGGWVEVMTTAERGRGIVSVANTGPVIPPAAVDELVRPFRQHGADRAGRREGLGLGLSIVAAIAEAHDAELAICPRPDGGLRVQVSFPEPGS